MHTETKGVDVAGHRLHQMLIVFPLGLLAGSLIFDIVHWFDANPRWGEISYWMIAVGIISALVSAVFGAVDWWGIPKNTRAKQVGAVHGIGNVVVVALFIVSWFLRRDIPGNPSAAAYTFSIIGVLLAVITGWLGGELVAHYRIGVHVDGDLNARPTVRNPDAPGRVHRPTTARI
jgi:uncharacterized membrane protein